MNASQHPLKKECGAKNETMDTEKMRGQRGSGDRDTPGKILFENNARFAEVFNHTLLRGHPIAPEELSERDSTEAALLELSGGERIHLQLFRDVSRYAEKLKRVFSVLSIENQDKIDYQIPLRILEEDTVSYARQARKIVQRNRERWNADHRLEKAEKAAADGGASMRSSDQEAPPYTAGEFLSGFRREDRIIPNITLVVYFGEEPWDGPRSLRDMFVESPFQTIAPDYAIHVLDVRRLSDQEIQSYSDDLRVLFFMLKHARDKDKLKAAMSEDRAFQNVSDDVLSALTPYIGKRRVELLQPPQGNRKGGLDMDTWFAQLFEAERQEGWDEGRAEGWNEGRADGWNEGRADGWNKGRAEGIQALVDVYRNEMHLDNDTILSKLISKFQIPRDYAVSLL